MRERRRARVVGGRGRLRGVPAEFRRRGRRRRGRPARAAVEAGIPGREYLADLGADAIWLTPFDPGPGLLCFAREPGFILAANLGAAPAPLPAHREILLASGPVTGGTLPPDTAAWLCA